MIAVGCHADSVGRVDGSLDVDLMRLEDDNTVFPFCTRWVGKDDCLMQLDANDSAGLVGLCTVGDNLARGVGCTVADHQAPSADDNLVGFLLH